MQTSDKQHPSRAWYALRRTLVPWDFDHALDDLISYCQSVPVDEIIIKCDTEEFSHGHPSLAWLQAYQPKLLKARDALQALGVVYSLNPWVTIGHLDRGRDVRPHFPDMQTLVGHRGERTRAQACPLCPVWRSYVASLWQGYAETSPAVIWVEDDIRMFNHKPVQYGCFCDLHLQRFAERVGEVVDRPSLVEAVFQAGTPHPWRREWLVMQREVMNETVAWLGDHVREVSPDTALGLMSSGPENHVLCGRDWSAFAGALGGGKRIYSRPPLGNYNENHLRGLYYTARQIRATRACLPQDTVEQAEVENWWFTQYSKSVAFTRLQMMTCYLFGADGVTMNLYDHVGTPLSEDTTMGPMLARDKRYFTAISERCQGKAPCGGVRILQHRDAAMHKVLPQEAGLGDLIDDGYGWDAFLEALGFSTTWDEGSVTAVTGQVLRCLDEQAILNLFKGGVLLDLTAVEVLHERGLGDLTGVAVEKVMKRYDWQDLAAEEWHNERWGGTPGKHLTMTIPDLLSNPDIAVLRAQQGTEVVSRLVSADREVMAPCCCVREHADGGRVAVFPLRMEGEPGSLMNPKRKQQFSRLLHWLARGELPLEVTAIDGVCPLPIRRDFEDHTILAALNLSLDPWSGVVFDWACGEARVSSVRRLSGNGQWVSCDAPVGYADGRAVIRLEESIAFTNPVVLDIVWT